VTYDELRNRLKEGDRQYVETLSDAMRNYERQWLAALQQKSLASGMDIGRLDAQLDYLAKEIFTPRRQPASSGMKNRCCFSALNKTIFGLIPRLFMNGRA
jgi:hypothetical protein